MSLDLYEGGRCPTSLYGLCIYLSFHASSWKDIIIRSEDLLFKGAGLNPFFFKSLCHEQLLSKATYLSNSR